MNHNLFCASRIPLVSREDLEEIAADELLADGLNNVIDRLSACQGHANTDDRDSCRELLAIHLNVKVAVGDATQKVMGANDYLVHVIRRLERTARSGTARSVSGRRDRCQTCLSLITSGREEQCRVTREFMPKGCYTT